jgi:hypothetical protein
MLRFKCMRYKLLVGLLLATSGVVAQDTPGTAQARLEAQLLKQSADFSAKGQLVTWVLVVPRDEPELMALNGKAVLVVSVSTRDRNQSRVKALFHETSKGRAPLICVQANHFTDGLHGGVIGLRTDYFYTVSTDLLYAQSTFQIDFESKSDQTFALPPTALPYALPTLGTGSSVDEYYAALRLFLRREFPDEPSNLRVTMTQKELQPRAISQPPPRIPSEVFRNRITGSVVLKVIIGKDGKVKETMVVSGPYELIPPIEDAVRKWQYTPLVVAGEPAEIETSITVNYQIG